MGLWIILNYMAKIKPVVGPILSITNYVGDRWNFLQDKYNSLSSVDATWIATGFTVSFVVTFVIADYTIYHYTNQSVLIKHT